MSFVIIQFYICATYYTLSHNILLFQFFDAAAAAEEGNAVIEERSQPYGFPIPIGQYLHVCAMPVSVQNQVIDNEHQVNVFCPAVPNAEFQW